MSSKTILRSIRFSDEQDRLLKADAKKRGISVNALLSEIITRYAEWDRFAQRFPMISISRQGFRSLMDSIGKEKLLEHAAEAGSKNAPEISLFWFGKLDVDTFFQFVHILSKYGNTFEYEHSIGQSAHLLAIHHELGPGYSEFLAHYFDAAIRKIIGVAPRLELGKNSITIRFAEPLP